jgi:hypothetical protein
MTARRAGATLLLCVAVVGATSVRPRAAHLTVEQFLRSRFGLAASQLEAIRRGRPVAILLPTAVDREIQVGGAVYVKASPARLAALLQDVERLESGEGFLRTRRISSPPQLADFSGLELPAGDVASLRTCRPDKCDVKLGKGAFDLLARIDWNAPDVVARVNELARRTALEYVEAYRKGGNAELASTAIRTARS